MSVNGIGHPMLPAGAGPGPATPGPAGPGPAAPGPGILPEPPGLSRAQERRNELAAAQEAAAAMDAALGDLSSAANSINTPTGFEKLKLDSSHPDIVEGMVTGPIKPGSFEFEVQGLASQAKHAAIGFPDRNDTPVGFGYMGLEGADGSWQELTIDPGSTLNDVAAKINDSAGDFRATIVNTGMAEEPYRLLVSSQETGEATNFTLDPDTTFMEFENVKQGADLKAQFEGIDIKSATNKLDKLVDGLTLDVKQSAPGTRIQLNVQHDLDKSIEGVRELTTTYNRILQQAQNGAAAGGTAASDMRRIVRELQGQTTATGGSGSFPNLASVGITTNAKTGELMLDESKLQQAMAKDYDSVAGLFSATEGGPGFAARLSETLRNLRDPVAGPLQARQKSLRQQIRQQDKEVERQVDRFEERKASMERQMQALNGKMMAAQAQTDFLSARLGGPQSAAMPSMPGPQGGMA